MTALLLMKRVASHLLKKRYGVSRRSIKLVNTNGFGVAGLG